MPELSIAFVANPRDRLADVDEVQRYITGAVLRDQRRYGRLPFNLEPADIVQEVIVELLEEQLSLVRIRKDQVAAAIARVLRRHRDRKYQRRRAGLPEICELDFDPVTTTNYAEVARLAAELQDDLGRALSDEEAVIWHKLVTEGSKTVREIGAELGIRHQRVSEVRCKLETAITKYLLSLD